MLVWFQWIDTILIFAAAAKPRFAHKQTHNPNGSNSKRHVNNINDTWQKNYMKLSNPNSLQCSILPKHIRCESTQQQHTGKEVNEPLNNFNRLKCTLITMSKKLIALCVVIPTRAVNIFKSMFIWSGNEVCFGLDFFIHNVCVCVRLHLPFGMMSSIVAFWMNKLASCKWCVYVCIVLVETNREISHTEVWTDQVKSIIQWINHSFSACVAIQKYWERLSTWNIDELLFLVASSHASIRILLNLFLCISLGPLPFHFCHVAISTAPMVNDCMHLTVKRYRWIVSKKRWPDDKRNTKYLNLIDLVFENRH